MNFLKKIKNAIKKYSFNPLFVDMAILPTKDYSIDQKNSHLWLVSFDNSLIGMSRSEDLAVKYCWSHWRTKRD